MKMSADQQVRWRQRPRSACAASGLSVPTLAGARFYLREFRAIKQLNTCNLMKWPASVKTSERVKNTARRTEASPDKALQSRSAESHPSGMQIPPLEIISSRAETLLRQRRRPQQQQVAALCEGKPKSPPNTPPTHSLIAADRRTLSGFTQRAFSC